MVGSPSIADGNGTICNVFQWGKPLGKNVFTCSITLQIDAPYFAGTVVYIEIGRKLVVFR